MKEQLANMTIIELVRTAHSYATSIQQIDTYSAIVTELASRLEALNLAHIGGMNAMRSAISERDQLAAENADLKLSREVLAKNALESCNEIYCAGYRNTALHDGLMESTGNRNKYPNPIRALVDEAKRSLETPTTDAWQREQRQKTWAEGINYTAGRLAAAFNHGCVNKPMAEVGDVVRMILTTKDDLANDPAPAADGLSGEYAEKSLQDWEQQLRNGEAV